MTNLRRRMMMSYDSKLSIVYNYLTIEALEDGLNAKLSINVVEYCVDGDGDWKILYANTVTESINAGQTLSFRGFLTPSYGDGIGTFTITRKYNLKGNCNSLLFGDNAASNNSLNRAYAYVFYKLFANCDGLVSAKDLILPATTLTMSCYECMFSGCTSLTTAPALPATTLADFCYSNMFNGCSSLTTAPTLPATTLASYCYYYMFCHCTRLTTVPELPATTLASYCCSNMFYNCSSLTTVPELPATTLADHCYHQMFYYCSSLTTAPELPATTLVNYCYNYMFCYCTKLNYIKMLATNISAFGCLNGWVEGVASTGTFVKHTNMNSLPTGAYGIPKGWTVQNA